MVTGERRWYIIGCYLALENTLTIESVVAALKERPRGAKLLVAGDLNINLEDPEGYCREGGSMAALMTSVLEDILAHFLLRRRPWCRYGRTWSIVGVGR